MKSGWKFFTVEKIWGCEATGDQNSVYLTRLILMQTPGFIVALHLFHRSDRDGAAHDHPWNFWTVCLWRGYREQILDTTVSLPITRRTQHR